MAPHVGMLDMLIEFVDLVFELAVGQEEGV